MTKAELLQAISVALEEDRRTDPRELYQRWIDAGLIEDKAMKLNDKWWNGRADIPNQSGFRLILRLKGNETRLDKVVLCPDGCYRLATTDIDKVEGWLPVEVPSLSLGQSGLKFHPGS